MRWLSSCLCVFVLNIASAQVTGDECLFCHRSDIGPSWQRNRHGLTIRASGEEHVLGTRDKTRRLRQHGYGNFAILTAAGWNATRFAERCAGCHASSIDPAARTFAAHSLECYVCHGNVDLEHANDTSLVWLSKKRRGDARAVTSICAGCHLRGGRSRSTGLPYPVSFTAGDDLFHDYQADFTRADDPKLNPGDRHVWRNVRDVVTHGKAGVTCLSCHQVHAGSSQRHRRVLRGPICEECHEKQGPMTVVKPYQVHSPVCEY